MRHVLARVYNRSYDFFFFRYLNANGINLGEESPFEQVEDVTLEFQNEIEVSKGERPSRRLSSNFRLELDPPKRLLLDYAMSWKMEPGPRPSTIHVLERTLKDGERLNADLLGELERQLPNDRRRLLFSDSDAAADFGSFYKAYLRNPLARDLENLEPRRLLKYFTIDDMKGLPDIREEGQAKLDEAVRQQAAEVLARVTRMTAEVILPEILGVLNEHWQGPEHPRFGDKSSGYESCQHKSECVELFCTREVDDGYESVTLRPSRGFLIWLKNKHAPQYADFKFPQYRVFRESEAQA